MRSTGEVMGIDADFGVAFAKSQLAAYGGLPTEGGAVFVSMANRDKRAMIFPVKRLVDLGFRIYATTGTAEVLRRHGIEAEAVRKITERAEGASTEGHDQLDRRTDRGPPGADGRQQPERALSQRRVRHPHRHHRGRPADHHHRPAARRRRHRHRRARGGPLRSSRSRTTPATSTSTAEGRPGHGLPVYRTVFDTVLTRTDAEGAHHRAFGTWRRLAAVPRLTDLVQATLTRPDPAIGVEVFGKAAPQPARAGRGLRQERRGHRRPRRLGTSGAIEVGTITGHGQPGNDRPRLFRLPQDRAIINRMGFNNDGSAVVATGCAAAPPAAPRRHPPRRQYRQDQGRRGRRRTCRLCPQRDSPGAIRRLSRRQRQLAQHPILRDLQAVAALRPLLSAVREAADGAAGRAVPCWSRSPRPGRRRHRRVAELVVELGLAGVVATNTTIARTGLRTDAATVARIGAGGLSGPVLQERSHAVLRLLRAHLPADCVVISVGGGLGGGRPGPARRRATLVQAYPPSSTRGRCG